MHSVAPRAHRFHASPIVRAALAVVVVASAASIPLSAHAGVNLGAHAALSFSPDSVVTQTTSRGSILPVYVWLTGAARVKGAEFVIRWHTERGDSLLSVLGEKHPSGTRCGGFLMRGQVIGIPQV